MNLYYIVLYNYNIRIKFITNCIDVFKVICYYLIDDKNVAIVTLQYKFYFI